MQYTTYYVYNANGNEVWRSWWNGWNSTTKRQDLSWQVDLTSGTYYFCVARADSGYTGPYNFILAMQKDMGGAEISVAKATYSGEELTPAVNVTFGGIVLEEGVDYEVVYSNNVNAGKGVVAITGIGAYTGEKEASFTIAKAANAMKARTKGTPIKRWRVRAGYRTVYGRVLVTDAAGQVVYKNMSSAKKHKAFKVDRSSGSVTIPYNVKKGLYKLKIKVIAKGDSNHKASSSTVTLRIRVK